MENLPVPEVFIRLYLNLQSKKFRKNTKVVEAKKQAPPSRCQLPCRLTLSHIKPRKREPKDTETSAARDWSDSAPGLRRHIRFESADRCHARRAEEDEEIDEDETEGKDCFSRIVDDLRSEVRAEKVSIFSRCGRPTDTPCFTDLDLGIAPENSAVPRIVSFC